MKLQTFLPVAFVALLCSCDESPVSTELTETSDATIVESKAADHTTGAELDKRIADSDHGGRPLTAELNGQNEVPGPGDPDGSGFALITLNQGQGEVCFELSAQDIGQAVAAHIHFGTADVAGGIAVFLAPPPEDGTVTGCQSDVDKELIKDIRTNPSAYYVNVHTPAFPPGAVRGQLSK